MGSALTQKLLCDLGACQWLWLCKWPDCYQQPAWLQMRSSYWGKDWQRPKVSWYSNMTGPICAHGNCLIICCNGRPASVRRHTLFCVYIHTRALTLPYTRSFRLFAQILTLVAGSQPSPTLASSALHTHTLFSDSPLRNDGAHLPNRPCNLFENLCLRDEDGSPPDFITFPWPQRLTDLIAQSLVPPPLSSPTFLAQMTGLDDEEMVHSHGNPRAFNLVQKLFAAVKMTSLFSEWKSIAAQCSSSSPCLKNCATAPQCIVHSGL